jgi:NhaP-type Na+/H+ and K+/H+ antiporter
MEKIKNNSASSAEISKYLADRGKQENPISDNEVLDQDINDQEAKVMALDLIDLTLEKQDLIKSIESDKKNVDSEKYSDISQDEILKILDIDFSEIDFRKLNMEVSDKQNVSDSVVEAEKRLEEISKKIGVYLSNKKIEETYQKVLQEKIETIRLARQVENMKKFVDKINLSNNLLLARRSSEDIKINKADLKVQDKNQEIANKINEKISELLGVSEVYYEVNRRELLNYRNQYIKGGFIETPSEKEKVLEI